jgi:replicative DNA helicase
MPRKHERPSVFEGLGAQRQFEEWERVATDPRPRVQTGWPQLDGLLHRASLGPGNFCILAGRMHTRKTAVALNLTANFLAAGVPVGFVGLDEPVNMYVNKLASVQRVQPHGALDAALPDPGVATTYLADNRLLSLATGPRPSFADLDAWLAMSEVSVGAPLRVVFIDYLTLMEREAFAGGDNKRIPLLAENLAVWTRKHGLVTIALHQVGRQQDDMRRYHGHTPITPEQLMHGGEQQADIIFGTYRPAMDPIGNMTRDQALADGVDADEWSQKANRVSMFQQDTFLQVIKNRPGTLLNHVGVQLRSVLDTQKMEVSP